MLTLLHFAQQICPQFCALPLLKSEVFIQKRGRGEWGLGSLFLNFLEPPLFRDEIDQGISCLVRVRAKQTLSGANNISHRKLVSSYQAEACGLAILY